MDFTIPCFSMKLDGRQAAFTLQSHSQTADCGKIRHVLTWQSGVICVTQTTDVYETPGAHYSRLCIENTSDAPSPVISELCDLDMTFPLAADAPRRPGLRMTEGAKIVSPAGSTWARDEFYPKEAFLKAGESKRYANTGGRSSQEYLPFFDVNRYDCGVMLGIGWSGQWFASFARGDGDMCVKAGIDVLKTYLLPGEHIETASTLVMTYQSGQNRAHNDFKRLLKNHFVPVGRTNSVLHAERPQIGPVSMFAWGGLPSARMLARIDAIKPHNLGFEYYWIDAGWYGRSTQPCPDEFAGDWAKHTGDWRVNTNIHPKGLEDVAEAVRGAGMELLLWVEPERVVEKTPVPAAHPEWFLHQRGEIDLEASALLNLGHPEALQYAVDMVSGLIERLGLACYREDFNINPMYVWRDNDAENRVGMSEIGFVNGLYAFWDALLMRFPKLLIDNCASGGRRIDLMTIQRAMPLWRSDYMCVWNYDPEAAQTHNCGISWWLPYNGTGVGHVLDDVYHFRSAYTSSLLLSGFGYEWQAIDENTPFDAIRVLLAEYKEVRPFFSCDYYPLAAPPLDMSSWCVECFDRPEQNDGIVLAFRRPESLSAMVDVRMEWIADGDYEVYDFDEGESYTCTAESLREGLTIILNEKRSSKLLKYKKRAAE